VKPPSARRKAVDKAMFAFMGLAVLLALIPLVAIVVEVVLKGIGAIHGLSFLTQPPPGDATATGGGLANAVVGTLIMVALASVVFIPLGIIGAVYLVEFGSDNRLSRAVRFFAEVMTGIPSIMVGVFAYGILVVYMHHFSAIAGALALGLIMWPIVLRTSEEMLGRVPSTVREASMALGTPRWRTVLKVVLPTAAAGLTTGSMLAVARAAGETAPLLFTALGSQYISFKITQPMSALPLEIYSGATSPFPQQIQRAWAGALTLIALVLAFTLVARFVAARRGV
jgi:phosphate transport system permease protein